MLNEKSDELLVRDLRDGSGEAFIEIMERYTQKVHNLAVRLTRNQEDAEEVLQDVFVTVHQKINSFEGKSAFSSWLYRITVNTAFMKLRRRRQTPTISLEEVCPSLRESWTAESSEVSDLDFMCSRHELRSSLESAIEKLPEEYRLIFILRDVDGLSNQDVSEILSLSVPAVKSRLHRSRLMLRKRLQKFYDDYTSQDKIYIGSSLATAASIQ